jgi:hypothetical protein
MWTDIKVGALDLINSAINPLINKFTELGRIRQQYADQGGDERVQRQLNRLRGIGTDIYRRGTYKAQLANYDTKIGSYQQYLADYKTWGKDKTAVGAYDRMQAFQKQTGLSTFSDVKEQLAVFQKMRSEYVKGAKAILQANPAPSPAASGDGKGSKTTTTKTTTATATEQTEFQQNQTKINTLTQEYVKLGDDATDSARARQEEIRKEIQLLEQRNDKIKLYQEQAQGKMLGGNVQTEGLAPHGVTAINTKALTTQTKPLEKLQTIGKSVTEEWNDAAKALSSVGMALNTLEDPAAKVLGIIAQAIATVALTFAKSLSGTATPWDWIAAAATGTATMISTISAIQSATASSRYAQGGVIKGSSYSGDNLMAVGPDGDMIGLNAGEVVLNKAQTAALASSLSNGGGDNGGSLRPSYISGEQIYIALNRYTKRIGKGEIVTWK